MCLKENIQINYLGLSFSSWHNYWPYEIRFKSKKPLTECQDLPSVERTISKTEKSCFVDVLIFKCEESQVICLTIIIIKLFEKDYPTSYDFTYQLVFRSFIFGIA